MIKHYDTVTCVLYDAITKDKFVKLQHKLITPFNTVFVCENFYVSILSQQNNDKIMIKW